MDTGGWAMVQKKAGRGRDSWVSRIQEECKRSPKYIQTIFRSHIWRITIDVGKKSGSCYFYM